MYLCIIYLIFLGTSCLVKREEEDISSCCCNIGSEKEIVRESAGLLILTNTPVTLQLHFRFCVYYIIIILCTAQNSLSVIECYTLEAFYNKCKYGT